MTNNLLHGGTTNDEGFKSLSEELFDQIFRANPDVSSNGLVRAAVKAAEENPHAMEASVKKKEDDEELTAQMIEAGEAILSESARQAEELRRHQEAWDNAPSSEYPGMTNKEVLAGLQLICGNLPYYTDMAVKKGWIKEEDKDKFAKYLLDKEWLMQQERDGKTNTPEYIARKRQFEIDKRNNPDFDPAEKNMVNATKGMGINATAANTLGQTANLKTGANSIDAGVDALNIDAEDGNFNPINRNNILAVKLPWHSSMKEGVTITASPWHSSMNEGVRIIKATDSELFGNDVVAGGALKTSGLSLSNEFNKEAPNATTSEPIKTVDTNITVQLNQVKPAQFTQSNGMI